MKSDLGKLIMVIWLSAMLYFTYEIWIDVKYMADLMHAYARIAIKNDRH